MLASIAACVSAIVAVVALREIKKQRESSYHPELFLSINSAKAVIKENKEEDASIIYRQFIDDKETDLDLLHFTIENIGFGAAKEVKIEWFFDYKKALKMIEDINPKAHDNSPMDGYLQIRNAKKETIAASWVSWEDIDPTTYDFALPRSQEKFNLGAHIPNEIIDLFVAYAILNTGILNVKELFYVYREEFKGFPKLKASVSYKDIGDKTYRKNFNIGFLISAGIYEPGTKPKDLRELELSIYNEIKQIV